jgi:hypothetical protein
LFVVASRVDLGCRALLQPVGMSLPQESETLAKRQQGE